MKIVLAPDSFKESMTAAEVAAAMAEGARRAVPDAECIEVPLADGGEGTAEALISALGAERRTVRVPGPLGALVDAEYGLTEHGLAVLEMASASGIELLAPPERDIMRSSTEGVAAMIRDALDAGATRFVVGLGGSATNDGGAGLLAGLGAALLNADGGPVTPAPVGLRRLARVDLSGLDPRLAEAQIEIACDVTNPLLGPNGASAVFGPQKGASEVQVEELDRILGGWADALESATGERFRDFPGAGAAGGLGFAFLALGATARRGIELVIDASGLEQHLEGADLVLTGEGSVDGQTLSGKTPYGVAQVAAHHGVPVIAFAGRVGPGAEQLLASGFDDVVPILPEPFDLETALRDGPRNLERAVCTVLRERGES